ncbi:MAG: protein-export chaperone SecB, partial [Alphaproteobacteria bacterium]|nr:protein-export chaperone SecB [Alphaproteobacteria bacterium]
GAPASIREMQQKKPEININVQVNARNAAEEGFEVSLVINVEAKIEDKSAFIVELDYAALFGVRNLPKDQLEPLLLVQCPQLMFPFARRILADVSRDGGYMPLLIDPIDFGALYQHYKARGEAEIKPN